MGNFVEHAFDFLSALTSADQVNYGNLDPKTGIMDVATNTLNPEWHAAVVGFGQCMAKYPLFRFDPAVNDGRPFFRSDFISARQFRDLDIFSECFKLLGMSNHCAVHVPTDDGRLLWFGIERAGRTDFTERDREMLAMAQPHLANARRLAQARQQTRDEFPFDAGTFCRTGFTPRESDVAYWLTEGKTNVEIAVLIKVQVQTVKAHVTALFNKTGSSNRLALTLHLMDLGRKLLAGETPFYQVSVLGGRPPNVECDCSDPLPLTGS